MRIAMSTMARAGLVCQIERSIDQRDMREGLRKIAHHSFELEVVLLRKQAEVIAQLEQAFKERSRVLHATNCLEAAHHPKAAGKKHTLTRGQSVLYLRRVVAQHETCRHKLTFNRLNRTFDAWIAARQETDHRHQEQGGVQIFRTIS